MIPHIIRTGINQRKGTEQPSFRKGSVSGKQSSGVMSSPSESIKPQMKLKFNQENLLMGILYSEILGPPKSRRNYRYGGSFGKY